MQKAKGKTKSCLNRPRAAPCYRAQNHRTPRRGIILLVVLLLLALLSVTLLTLVMVTARARLSAKAAACAQPPEPPLKLLNQAFAQVVRGSTDADSVIGAHSLLEDLYGNGGLVGQVDSTPVTIAGNALPPPVKGAGGAVAEFNVKWPPNNPPPPTDSGYYGGRVLTGLTGPTQGHSARIISSIYTPPIGAGSSNGITTLRIITPEGIVPNVNDQFLINGRPFSGTGFGFDPATFASSHLLDASDLTFGQPLALLPNHAALIAGGTYTDPAGPGGANEDYDAIDFQNMLLALQQPSTTAVKTVLPSLHRPELINYWMNAQPALWANTDFQRRVILRPLPADHPNFTGGNPSFDPSTSLKGPWDVDNDGDGEPDSIWVDLGFGVRHDRRGKPYKPLFAILCVDLDGRLNLNAHGNLSHLQKANSPTGPIAGSTAQIAPPNLPVGQGYGTAEINLGGLFDSSEMQALFVGSLAGGIEGRYGEIHRLDANLNAVFPRPGWAQSEDLLNQLQQFEFPQEYKNFLLAGDFGTPPDLDGDGQVALDFRGQPYYLPYSASYLAGALTGWGEPGERIDDPYELNLSRDVMEARRQVGVAGTEGTVPIDARFTPGELSAVLRKGDVDAASLPSRLLSLAPTAFVSGTYAAANRRRVTTDSWDLPVPSMLMTSPGLLAGADPLMQGGLPQMLKVRMAQNNFAGDFTTAAAVLLSPESRAGLRLDINRPLGNGADDNGNYVVDEPAEANSEASWSGVYGSPVAFDLNDDGHIDGLDMQARQVLARHLYVLLMLFKDQAFVIDRDGDPKNNAAETARWLAQWAVNVVDFRDRDSIMTPFEYVINPFAPNVPGNATIWNVDGDPYTQESGSDVVWGCERPELLITETLAFHDRGTADTSLNKLTSEGNDPDFDQVSMPVGSLFVELYNPWRAGAAWDFNLNPGTVWSSSYAPPSELAPSLDGSIDLSRKIGGFPVWRLLIAQIPNASSSQSQQNALPDPDQPASFKGCTPERCVYFTVPPNPGVSPATSQDYYTAAAINPISPGHYAVIGPGTPPSATPGSPPPTSTLEITKLGQGYGQSPISPQIALDRQLVSSMPVMVSDNTSQGSNTPPVLVPPSSVGNIKLPTAIIIDQPRRLSVSEPKGGYGPQQPPQDHPFDLNSTLPDKQAVLTTGTTQAFRVVYLQRLANPLEAYDPKRNPYLTVDSMPVDLTSFTGWSENQGDTPTAQQQNGNATLAFASRQRGDSYAQQQTAAMTPSNSGGQSSVGSNSQSFTGQNELWAQEPLTMTLPTLPATLKPPAQPIAGEPASDMLKGNCYFPHPVRQTLGFLNNGYFQNYWLYYASDWSGYAAEPTKGTFWTSSNSPYSISPLPPPAPPSPPAPHPSWKDEEYVGDPERPFPWLTWNNRPYTGAFELLTVPACQSSQLLSSYSLLDWQINSYSPPLPQYYDSYHYLLAFFGASPLKGPSGAAANLYRFLEFVGVPSRFIATDTYQKPSLFSGAAAGTEDLHPPFNHVSTYREPGRVNINTILDKTVWNSVVDSFQFAPNLWPQIASSRRSMLPQIATTADPFAFNASYPTLFVRPFRSFAGAPLVPLATMNPLSEVEATILRAATNPAQFGSPMFAVTSTDYATETSRNPYFRNQLMQKLSNLLTTRSNVYAVWITMGEFEVEPVAVDDAHPDGYRLAAERGGDTGQTRRHRAFYLYDRTVPVGFQRGSDLNVDEGVLLRQFIE